LLSELQEHVTQVLKDAGAGDGLAKLAGQLIAQGTAAGIGAAASGGNTAGAAMGLNVDANNRQLHPSEKQRIKELAKGDKELEEKLTRAACYEVKCWAEYPEGSSEWQRKFVGIGESIALANELLVIKNEQKTNKLFVYTEYQKAWDDFKSGPLQGVKNTGKLVGGGLAAYTGGVICGAGGCIVGGPVMAFGSSEAIEGATGLYNQYQGNGKDGFNPLKTGANILWPVWGDTIYNTGYLLTSVISLAAIVPAKIGVIQNNSIYVSDGINRSTSLFGVTVPRWQNPIINPVTGEVFMTNNSARVVSGYGVVSKVTAIDADIEKARGRK
jgi:filamentous hemagglutinin